MDFIFADDARHAKPSRKGMSSVVAIGGIHVAADAVGPLERRLEGICAEVGLPRTEQFKWSPGKKEEFLRTSLKDAARRDFFLALLGAATEFNAKACVVIVDTTAAHASKKAASAEDDATILFLERCEWALSQASRDGLLVVAGLGGGAKDEAKFLETCVGVIAHGTEYIPLRHLPLGVITLPSRRLRLLQLADLVTSCSTARFSGESDHSPPVFEAIKPLLRSDGERIGGIGLKIHPDFKYGNLYHWLLGDTHFWKRLMGHPMPLKGIGYYDGPGEATE